MEKKGYKIDGVIEKGSKILHKEPKRIMKAIKGGDKLNIGEAKYLEIDFKDKSTAEKAYNYINNEIWAGVKSGNLDVAFSSPSANSLKQPSLFLFSGIPFGPELTEFRVWMAYGGGQIIKDRIYKNNGLHAIDCMVIPPETGGWFKKKINNKRSND